MTLAWGIWAGDGLEALVRFFVESVGMAWGVWATGGEVAGVGALNRGCRLVSLLVWAWDDMRVCWLSAGECVTDWGGSAGVGWTSYGEAAGVRAREGGCGEICGLVPWGVIPEVVVGVGGRGGGLFRQRTGNSRYSGPWVMKHWASTTRCGGMRILGSFDLKDAFGLCLFRICA